jgi:hypothetical protein
MMKNYIELDLLEMNIINIMTPKDIKKYIKKYNGALSYITEM